MSLRAELGEAWTHYESAVFDIALTQYYDYVMPFLAENHMSLEVRAWETWEVYRRDKEGDKIYLSGSLSEYPGGQDVMDILDMAPIGLGCPLGAIMPEYFA